MWGRKRTHCDIERVCGCVLLPAYRRMVCDDCQARSLSGRLAAPDPWRAAGPSRRVDENKALRKGIRSNPYGNSCKTCKMRVQISSAIYCTSCAYGKGLCAVCGKQVIDTSMYRMSEGGNARHAVKDDRDESSFKSSEQIAREQAQQQLQDHLQQTGQAGRMPTRGALEKAGQKELASALIAAFGGLHAAAEAMGLSTRLLNEEAESRKQAKREAAQQLAEQQAEERLHRLLQQEEADGAQAPQVDVGSVDTVPLETRPSDADAPPGVHAAPSADSASPHVGPTTGTVAADDSANAAWSATASGPPFHATSTDTRWQYDPNIGLYFQRSTQCYFDSVRSMYFTRQGIWSREKT